ncbi:MAG: hypothetical protein M3280_03960 [Actinomycetota bacterium]|nr:hypothetical protein [Actinomycetota bacterium]
MLFKEDAMVKDSPQGEDKKRPRESIDPPKKNIKKGAPLDNQRKSREAASTDNKSRWHKRWMS